jgi:hypothetical protein
MNYNFSDYIIHNGNDLLPYLLWNIYSTLTSPTTRFLHFSYNKNDKFSNYNEIRKLRSQINGKSENYDLWKQYIIFSTKNSFIRTGSHRTLLRLEDFRPDCAIHVPGLLPPHASIVIEGCFPTKTRPFDT